MSLENKAIIIEKSIEQLQDFYSLVGLVENKLKETSRLILLLLEPDDNNERCDKLSQHLFVKLEEEDVNYDRQNLMIEENNSKDFASVAELYGKTVNCGENKLNLRDQNAQVNESITEIAEQTGTEAAIKVARMEMRKRVQEDPSRPIPQIYEEVRKETFNQFDESGQFAIAADFPPFRSVQSELFKERRCFIPPEPKSVQDLDLESGFLFEGEENIIKGDTIISENKRVVMFITNALLDVLARGKQILGDGTFKITPSLFHQVFCISSQVDLDGTFVTCAYVLLPDKTKESYNVMFSMLKEALSRRGLELSAEYFMSDFEINIRHLTSTCLQYLQEVVGMPHLQVLQPPVIPIDQLNTLTKHNKYKYP